VWAVLGFIGAVLYTLVVLAAMVAALDVLLRWLT